MTGEGIRLTSERSPQQLVSMGTPIPAFTALIDRPEYLGYRAHGRLEELLNMPIASDDARPFQSDEQTHRRSGERLGDLVGRQREFTRNLPQIKASMQKVAEDRGISEAQLWSEMTEILIGSGIGEPMYRTLDKPVPGGNSYGARIFIDELVKEGEISGIAMIVRENIANWGARRHDRGVALLGGMSLAAYEQLGLVVYAGGGRRYKDAELWRPEVEPYVDVDTDGKKVCSLTEATAAQQIHKPIMEGVIKKIAEQRGAPSTVDVDAVGLDDPGASGDAVMGAVIDRHGDRLRDMLIIEVGNAPAGYTQLAAGLVLAKELGIDPTQRFLAITDGVEIQHPNVFKALTLAQSSKVQNAMTALNSFNHYLQTIVRVNEYMLDRQAA